jgi:hypothetical protein
VAVLAHAVARLVCALDGVHRRRRVRTR